MSLKQWANKPTKTAQELINAAMHSPIVRESVRPLIEDQLDDHLDGKGNKLGYNSKKRGFVTEYSEATEKITGGRKKAGDSFDLKDSGRFRESIEAEPINTGSLFIDADTKKEDTELLEKFGEDIIELNKRNKEILAREKVLPELRKEAKRELLR